VTGYVLDDTLIDAFGHGSDNVARMIASMDARQIRMSVPAITLAVAQAVLSDEQCDEIDGVVDRLEHLQLAGLSGTEQVTELSRVIGALDDLKDIAAAHTVYVAATFDWPVITLDRSRWDLVRARLPWSLELVELSAPETE